MRLFIPLVFVALFIGWAGYRLFVKKDLKNYLNETGMALFFIAVWGLMYRWLAV